MSCLCAANRSFDKTIVLAQQDISALRPAHTTHFNGGSRLSEPSNLAAVADIFGPANLTEAASGFSPSGIQDVFGRNDHRDLVLASPTHYVAPNSPPILLVQGVADTTVLESQSLELYTAVGDQTQLILVRHMGHMFVQVGAKPIDPSLRQIANDIVGFFGQVLRVL